jgi:hypothetical protein
VVEHEIFPFLDYCERNAMNQALPFEERIAVPLKKDVVLSMALSIQVSMARGLLKRTENRDQSKRETALLILFSSFDSMNYILQHNIKFRAVVLEKCTKYSNINDDEYLRSGEEFKEALQQLCQKAIIHIVIKYPYKYEVQMTKPAESSPAIQTRYVMKDVWAKRAEARRTRLSYNSLYK